MLEKTPVPTLEMLRNRRTDILQIAERRGVKNVRVFGSVARGEDTANSDIDLLVDLPPHFSLLDFSGLVREMQEVVGRRVEIASAAHLREEFRDGILRDARLL